MKVFLENFSQADIRKIAKAVPEMQLVNQKEESEFWFPNTIAVKDVIDILVNGVVMEDENDISPEDLEQKKA